jgi:hypothetical protein
MKFIIKSTPEEVLRAKKWWNDLEAQWKMVYNEALLGKGPVLAPPSDDELMMLVLGVTSIRIAGPLAVNPNTSIILTNLSGLIPLYNLTYLSISNMKITNLLELKRHTKLEHLFVYDNKLTSLSGIEGMQNLKELYFQNNEISDLSPIKGLIKLETIYATGNTFDKINGITTQHENIKNFYVMPNPNLRDREVIRVQNEIGILCKKG